MKPSIQLTLLFSFFISGLMFAQGRSQFNSKDTAELAITIVQLKAPSCNGEADGAATIKVTGGESPYSYNWNTFPNQYKETAINLASGIYFIYVKDAEGNTSYKSIHIAEPNKSVLADRKNVDVNKLELTASVSGASSYQFEMDEELLGETKVGELPVGVHKIKITDDQGCVMVQYIQVFEVNGAINTEKSIQSTASYSNKKGKKILVSNLIPKNKESDDKEKKKDNYSIGLEKQ